jgi:hypothetical protein
MKETTKIIKSKVPAVKTDQYLGPIMKLEVAGVLYEIALGVENTQFVHQIVEMEDTEKKVVGADGTAIGRFYADRQNNFLWVMSWNAENFVHQLRTADEKGGFSLPNKKIAEAILNDSDARPIIEQKGITDFWQEKNPGKTNFVLRDVKMNKAFELGKFQDSYGEYSAIVAVRKVS